MSPVVMRRKSARRRHQLRATRNNAGYAPTEIKALDAKCTITNVIAALSGRALIYLTLISLPSRARVSIMRQNPSSFLTFPHRRFEKERFNAS